MKNQIKVKLTAYTKYVQPNMSDYVVDAPNDNKIYARKHKEWVDITDINTRTSVGITENSGLDLIHIPTEHKYILNVRKQEILETELPSTLEDDMVYYVESCSAQTYIWGGTAWSRGNNDYVYAAEYEGSLSGGTALTLESIDEIIFGVNSKGVYDGNSTN